MSRRVLLVDSDVDALGELASALRARGLHVINVNGAVEAVEQAFKRHPDVVLAAKEADEHGALTDAFSAVPELVETPILFLVGAGARGKAGASGEALDVRDANAAELGPKDVPWSDVDRIVSRINEASPHGPRQPSLQEMRGDLQQVPLIELLQLLSANRSSGVLGLTTTTGAGEVRLASGEVIDAVYRRLEGEKALYRLLGERDGHFTFATGEPVSVRRIASVTSRLLMEAMRQVDEVRRRRTELAPNGEAFFIEDISPEDAAPPLPSESMPISRKPTTRPSAPHPTSTQRTSSVPPTLRVAESDPSYFVGPSSKVGGPSSTQLSLAEERAAVAVQVATLLQTPHHLDELLDEISAPDLFILEALAQLHAAGKIRKVEPSDFTTPFATPEQLPIVRSLVVRLVRPGFALPPHLVIAASARRMAMLAHAVRRITDAAAPAEPPPRAPLPRPLGVLRLGEGVELALSGVPADDTFSPTWPLALHGAAAVIRLNDAGGEALEAHCQALELTLIDAESMMGSFDVATPGHVAALVRVALEMAAGA